MRVAILDDYQSAAAASGDWSGLEIRSFPEPIAGLAALAEALAPFEAVIAMRERTRFPAELFERLPNLRLLVTAGMRNAAIDIDAATRKGVQVCGTQTHTHPTVELTWALILGLARNIAAEAAAVKSGSWQTTLGSDLNGRVLGVVGLGRLGSRVARIGQAFGMRAIAWSPNLDAARARAEAVEMADRATLFATADFVSVHLVLGPTTRGLIGATDLARMKSSAFLVNTARAEIVDQRALLDALRERRIAGAGIDVFVTEPTRDEPLLALDNVLATPHLGYVTADNYRLIYGQAADAVRAFRAGGAIRPLNAIETP